jgi:hypothetical protein
LNEEKGGYKTEEAEAMARSTIEAGKTRTLKTVGCGTRV